MEELKKKINEYDVDSLENYFLSKRNNDIFVRLLAELCINKLSKPLGKIFVSEQVNIWSNIMEYLPFKNCFRIGTTNSIGAVFLSDYLENIKCLVFSKHYQKNYDLRGCNRNSINFINNFNNCIQLYCPNITNYKTYITSTSPYDMLNELINILFNTNAQHITLQNLSCNNFTSSTYKPFRFKPSSSNSSVSDPDENFDTESITLQDNDLCLNSLSSCYIDNVQINNDVEINNDIEINEKDDKDKNKDENSNESDNESDNEEEYMDEGDEVLYMDEILCGGNKTIDKIEDFIIKNYSWTEKITRLVDGKVNDRLRKLKINVDEIGLYILYKIIDLMPNLETIEISMDCGYYRKVHIEKQGEREEISVIMLREIYKKIGENMKKTTVAYFDCNFYDCDTLDFWNKVAKEESMMILHHTKFLEDLKIWGKITRKNLETICSKLIFLKSLTIDCGPDIFDFSANLRVFVPNIRKLTLIHRKEKIKTYITLRDIEYILAQDFLTHFSIKFSHCRYSIDSDIPIFTHYNYVMDLLESCKKLFHEWIIDGRNYSSTSNSSGFIISFCKL